MATATLENRVSIPKEEYVYLKSLKNRFEGFLAYVENSMEIGEARKEVKAKKIISQTDLFKKLGF